MIKDTRLLVEFAAVAQAGSFTRAAQELGVAQPWLSAQVRKLEEQLGTPLLDRSSRRLELTEWGQALFAIAAPLRQQSTQALADVAALSNSIRSRVRIGVPPDGLEEVMLRVLRDARLVPTTSEVSVERGVSESLVGRLQQGALDLTFFVGDFGLDPQRIEILPICPVFIDLLVDAGDPLHCAGNLRLNQLRGRTLSIFARALNPGLYDQLVGLAQQAGVAVGHFPELELQAPSVAPGMDTPIRLSMSTPLSAPPLPSCWHRVALAELNGQWLELARLRGNAFGPTRRALWAAASDLSKELAPVN